MKKKPLYFQNKQATIAQARPGSSPEVAFSLLSAPLIKSHEGWYFLQEIDILCLGDGKHFSLSNKDFGIFLKRLIHLWDVIRVLTFNDNGVFTITYDDIEISAQGLKEKGMRDISLLCRLNGVRKTRI